MTKMYCWRCQSEASMLEEEEYREIDALYSQGLRATQEFRRKHRLPLKDCNLQELFNPLMTRYKELTGNETPVLAEVRHHRVSLYGPPCKSCGKPLRSNKARMCAACGDSAI